MYKKKLLLYFVLIIVLASFSFAFPISSVTYSTYDNSYYLDKYAGENIVFSVSVTNNSMNINDGCTISIDSAQYVNMVYNSTSNFSFYNQTIYEPGVHNFTVYCNHNLSNFNFTVLQNYTINFTSNKLPMKTVPNTYYINASQINKTQNWTNMSCRLASSNMTSYFQKPFIGNLIYTDILNSSILIDCLPIGTLEIPISEYEPKLNISAVNPFSLLTSSSGFKFGNYDLNGDGVDDLIVLGSNGLMIYDGNEVRRAYAENDIARANYTNTGFTSPSAQEKRDFFITDMNWDGLGDIIINNVGGIYLLNNSRNFNFNIIPIAPASNVVGFGSYDVDGDFYKDLIVLNGSLNNFDYNIYKGNSYGLDLTETGKLNLTTQEPCDKFIIFDIDKNFIQDIACLDYTHNNQFRYILRNNLSSDLSNLNFQNYSLGYQPSDMFFTDVDSDGEWELGVKGNIGGAYFLRYYKFVSSSILKLNINQFNLSAISLFDRYSVDVLNENLNNELLSYYTDNFKLGVIYGNLLNYSSGSLGVITSLVSMNFANSDSAYLLTSYYNMDASSYNVEIIQNNILNYKDNPFSSIANISPDSDSPKVNFNISITSPQKYNNYFFKAFFSGIDNGKTFRNDYFDSQQNLKYYMVNKNNSYSFNADNSDAYSVSAAVNKYSMILTNLTTKSKANCSDLNNSESPFVFNSACGNIDNMVFKPVSITLTKGINTWNNISTNASISLTGVSGNIINSFFSINDVTINNSNLVFTNATFTNSNLILINSTIILNNTNVNVSLSSNSNLSAYHSIVNGVNANSNVYLYNSTSDITNSVLDYAWTYINFTDSSNQLIHLTGSYNGISFTNKNNISDWILNNTDANSVNCSFNFNLNYQYYTPDRNIKLNSTNTLVFVPTHIPTWNYSINGTHQTDFRNYSLLPNIANLNNVMFSLGETLQITANNYKNYSDKDLTGLLSNTSNSFTVNSSILNSNFTYQFYTTSLPFSRIAIVPKETGTVQKDGNILTGTLTQAGTYSFYHNLTFSADVDSVYLINTNFSIPLVYKDYYNITDGISSCNITFSQLENNFVFTNFSNILLSNSGPYYYLISCNDSRLEYVNQTGIVTISDDIISLTPTKRFNDFNLTFKSSKMQNYTNNCSSCILLVNNTQYDWKQTDNNCSTTLNLDSNANARVTCTAFNIDINKSIILDKGYMAFDDGNEITEFYISELSSKYLFLVSDFKSILTVVGVINNTYSYVQNQSYFNIPFNNSNLFLYSGDLYASGNKSQIMN